MGILFGGSIQLYTGNHVKARHIPEHAQFKVYLSEHVQFKVIVQND